MKKVVTKKETENSKTTALKPGSGDDINLQLLELRSPTFFICELKSSQIAKHFMLIPLFKKYVYSLISKAYFENVKL